VEIAKLAYRQAIAAHKLVEDTKGNILFLSKECHSNGCIGTLDVTYPSIPLFLKYNPELVKGMLRPILEFGQSELWDFEFAPHDVGQYPLADCQVYGYGKDPAKRSFDKQMPVEECGNMLLSVAAVAKAEGNRAFAEMNQPILKQWTDYLVQYGYNPENQLCTDDFAGKLANNINLAIKATVGIAAYAELMGAMENPVDAIAYRQIAEHFAKEIAAFSQGKTHLPLTWDLDENSFSLKYNLAFDKIFKFGLFEQELLEKETDYYLEKSSKYGCPLDNRKPFGKSDWLTWAATLTDSKEKREKLLMPLYAFLKETSDRVPFTDWYDVESGKAYEFKARSTQGACFILLL
jgi:hypothetical protein